MSLDTSPTTQDAMSVILQNYNARVGLDAQLNDVDYSYSPAAQAAQSSDAADTVLVATPLVVSPTKGKVTIRYRRMNLSVLSSSTPVVRGNAQMISDLIPQINELYGINLVDEDYDNEIVPANSPAFTFFIKPTSLLFIGMVTVSIVTEDVPVEIIRPENDDFLNAIEIDMTAASGSLIGNNTNGTMQSGEARFSNGYGYGYGQPLGGMSIWYKFTLQQAQVVEFTTLGSSLDTTVQIFTGSAVSALSLVTKNDNAWDGQNGSSRTDLTAEAGVTYYVAVDSHQNNESGEVTVNWQRSSGSIQWMSGADISQVYSPNVTPQASFVGPTAEGDTFEWSISWTSSGTDAAPATVEPTEQDASIATVFVQQYEGRLGSGVGVISLLHNGQLVNNTLVVVVSDTENTAYEGVGTYMTLSDIPQAPGTLLSTICSGTNQYGTFSDGGGSTYEKLIASNSTQCGYVQPTLMNINVEDMVANADDSFVLVGRHTSPSGDAYAFAAVKFTAAGSIEPGFASDEAVPGYSVHSIGGQESGAYAVAVQPDNSLVVVGKGKAVGTIADSNDYNLVVLRLTPWGAADWSFGTQGIFEYDMAGREASAFSVLVQPDGKIVVAGQGDSKMVAFRLNANGTMDNTFAHTETQLYFRDSIYASMLRIDGSIVFAGYGKATNGSSIGASGIARVNANGAPDTGFGVNGLVTLAESMRFGARAVTGASGGLTVIGGYGASDQGLLASLVRLTPDGTMDLTFGEVDGRTNLSVTPMVEGYANDTTLGDVITIEDGQLLVSTSYVYDDESGTQSGIAIFRLNADGTKDASYGIGGVVQVPYTDYWAQFGPVKMVRQWSGQVILGCSATSDGPPSYIVVRLNADGTLDNQFDTASILS